MQLHVEVHGEPAERELGHDGAQLAAFMSFANLRGFGATHPLIALADRLADRHHVAIGPLTIFYGHDPDDAEDREKLEYAWQDAGTLGDTIGAVLRAIDTDEQAATLVRRAGASDLVAELQALLPITRDAAAAGERIRLSFSE